MGSIMVGCVLLTSSPECVALSRCAIPVTHVIVPKIVMILSSFQHVHIGINWHGNDSRLFQYKTDIGLALLTEPVQHFLVHLSNRSKEWVFWMVNLVEIRRSLIYSKYFVLFSGCGVYKNHYWYVDFNSNQSDTRSMNQVMIHVIYELHANNYWLLNAIAMNTMVNSTTSLSSIISLAMSTCYCSQFWNEAGWFRTEWQNNRKDLMNMSPRDFTSKSRPMKKATTIQIFWHAKV